MSYVIGVDGGTESLRAFVFDLDGLPRGSHATAYKTDFPKPSWAEQDPEDWWQALGASVKGALAKANIAAQDVIALCVDTTCCSVVTLARDGRPLRPAMIWMDVRSARQADASEPPSWLPLRARIRRSERGRRSCCCSDSSSGYYNVEA
jgi:sugar (pentulose or hexulose) kinase